MTHPKANNYQVVLTAAAAYWRGEHVFARTLVDGLEDPTGDALALIGLLLAGRDPGKGASS